MTHEPGSSHPAPAPPDELGAHVSTAGGVQNAPARAAAIGAAVLQLFTKQPNRWAEPELEPDAVEAFLNERARHGITVAGSHDSYLINLSSPDTELWRRSLDSFIAELERCQRLELDFLVTHPGNATDGDLDEGVARNARAVVEALASVEAGTTRVLLELTAGSGTSVGGSFERLAELLDAIEAEAGSADASRVGVCVDTCHAFAAGYDLRADYDGVWARFDELIGFERLGLIHMNDSKHPLGSRRDRHEHIGKGTLGAEPFRRIMTDPRLAGVPKVLETPKGEDMVTADVENLTVLRRFRRPPRR